MVALNRGKKKIMNINGDNIQESLYHFGTFIRLFRRNTQSYLTVQYIDDQKITQNIRNF